MKAYVCQYERREGEKIKTKEDWYDCVLIEKWYAYECQYINLYAYVNNICMPHIST